MTTPKVQLAVGLFIAAMRDLQIALCEARSDGPQLAQQFADGHTQIVVDDARQCVEFVALTEDGAREWIETITTEYDRPRNWGALASCGVGAGAVQH